MEKWKKHREVGVALEKSHLLGYVVLFVGVALLIVTFFSAFGFLGEERGLLGSPDLVKAFGEALPPLVEAAIRAIYLGLMGWVGSILTMRGVQIIIGFRREEKAERKAEKKAEAQQQASQAQQAQPSPSGQETTSV